MAVVSVVNTRPVGQNQRLTQLLVEYGFNVFEFPIFTLSIRDPQKSTLSELLALPPSTHLVVTSANGIRALVKWKDEHPELRTLDQRPLIVVGEQTRLLAQAEGFAVALCPERQEARGIVEDLILRQGTRPHLAILRGNNSPLLLYDELQRLGFQVSEFILYEMVELLHSEQEQSQLARFLSLDSQAEPTSVYSLLTSANSARCYVRQVHTICESLPLEERASALERFFLHTVVAIGEPTAKALDELGFAAVRLAGLPSNEGLVEAVLRRR